MRLGIAVLFAAVSLLSAVGLKIPSSPQPAWTAPVGLHPMYRNEPPIVRNGQLTFIAHNDFRNRLYSLDAATGAAVWQSAFRAIRADAFADDSLRVFTLDRYYLGLHAQTGQEFDRNELLDQPNLYPGHYNALYLDGIIVVAASYEVLTGLFPNSGQNWKVNPGWAHLGSQTKLVAYQGMVLAGASSGGDEKAGLIAYRQQNGALVWTAPVKDATAVKVFGDIVMVDEGIYIDHKDYISTAYALDAATGRALWKVRTGEEFASDGWAVEKSQSDGNLLAMPCSKEQTGPFTLRVVELRTGAKKAEFIIDAAGFALSQGVVYAVSGKQVVGMDALSGKEIWRSAAFAERPSAPFASGGFIYAGDSRSVRGWVVQ